jgi:glycosyltransferase involved in cell wall biosynthesis
MAPYRLPVFRKLAQSYDLKMFFMQVTAAYRRWKVSREELEFTYMLARGPSAGYAVIPLNLCWELVKNKYDVIIAGETFTETIPSCLIIIFFNLLRRSKIILMTEYFENKNWLDRDRPVKRFKRAMFRAYLKFLYSRCDAFVACSSKAAGHLMQMGIPGNKIFESPQAVFDTQPLSTAEMARRKDKDEVTFVTVAYLSDRKGIDLLIAAFMALNESKTRLVIAGDGEIRGQLEAMASGNDNIVFAGHVDGSEKRDLYKTADVFVLPSLLETWGLVVNEAMHYGLPVIISDAMGSTDLIDGNGLIVPAGNQAALVHAMKLLAESREMRSTMSERSLEIIGLIDLNAVTEPFVNAIGHVSGEKAMCPDIKGD